MIARIPRLLHQFWTGPDMPSVVKDQVCRWTEMNPDWTHTVWDADRTLALLRRTFTPALAAIFQAALHPAMKSDIGRYAILYARGGVYVDTDTIPRSPLSDFIPRHSKVILIRVQRDSSSPYAIKNDFLACQQHNPLMLAIVREIVRRCSNPKHNNIHYLTGPNMLRDVARSHLTDPLGDATVLYRPDLMRLLSGLKIDYDEIGGHWSKTQVTDGVLSEIRYDTAYYHGLAAHVRGRLVPAAAWGGLRICPATGHAFIHYGGMHARLELGEAIPGAQPATEEIRHALTKLGITFDDPDDGIQQAIHAAATG